MGDPLTSYVNAFPVFQPMRQMPEFQALLAEMNLREAKSEPVGQNEEKE